jgi:ATPase subunit of ABC transporter with duplicated ATPase domains
MVTDLPKKSTLAMLEVNQLTVEFGVRALFRDVNLLFYDKKRYGLVGANGAGKSTFLRILTGQEHNYSGQINWPKDVRVGVLNQDHFAFEDQAIIEVVIQGKKALWDALQSQKSLAQKSELSIEESHAYSEAESVIQRESGYTAESEAAKLLLGLGIPDNHHLQALKTLSGGYKLRVLLAQLLFSQPEILLLDEPTNHLDIYSIKWLESYLTQYPGLLIVVSHDRGFLNGVCNQIVDIDYGTLRVYTGNYDAFEAAKVLEREQKEKALDQQDKRKEELQAFVDRFRAKATKASAAQSRVKMIEKMEEIEIPPSSRRYPHFRFLPHTTSGIVPLQVKDLAKSYAQKQVLSGVSFEVERGDRIALIGPNGVGKSTLLKILMKEIAADQGEFVWGHEVLPGYFPQDYHSQLEKQLTVFDWLYKYDATATHGQIRALLGQSLFSGDSVKHKLSTLSGGEATRLVFARLMLLPSNFLVLDEPTNHLDMESIESLTESLKNYKGTLLVVSHNRYFVSEVATRILELKPEGLVDFKGSYSEYLEKEGTDHLSRDVNLRQRTVLNQQTQSNTEKNDNALNYEARKQQQRRIKQLEKRIPELEQLCLELEEKIQACEPLLAEAYISGSESEQQHLLQQKEQLDQKMTNSMEEWEESEQELIQLQAIESE